MCTQRKKGSLISQRSFLHLDSIAMHIRVFYGSCEVFSTDTRLTESERFVRIFHGGHLGESRQYELSLLCKLFGPPTARQIELPLVNNYSKETMKVMDFLKRGILLEINEDHDIFVTRLCLTRVLIQLLYTYLSPEKGL